MGTIATVRKRPQACVIGLDGVPLDLLTTLAHEGVMPAVAGIIAEGRLQKMAASLPEISAVSWTDFMTGTNPGEHGIFGFTDLESRSYRTRFPNFGDVAVPTIWDHLGAGGYRSVVINQPSTYPAHPIPGILISGFVALDLARAVQPLRHLAELERMNYRIDIDTLKARTDRPFMWRELAATLESGRRAFERFWMEEWDFFELVVTGTDRLHHFLWNASEDAVHPEHGAFRDYYRRVDALVGEIADAFRKRSGGLDGLFLLSDHGFTGILREVCLNAWLRKAGYLDFDREVPAALHEMAPGSRAFAMDPSRIYVNLRGRFPRGTVSEADRKPLKREIAARLLELEHEGRRVIRRVFEAEEIYSGPHAQRGPDLVLLGERGYDLKGAVDRTDVFGRSDLQGMHTWDDAFFWTAGGASPTLKIGDAAGLILERFA